MKERKVSPSVAKGLDENAVKHTAGGEMPNTEASSHVTESEVEIAFQAADQDKRKPEILPESRSDNADEAEEQIEDDLNEQVYRARRAKS